MAAPINFGGLASGIDTGALIKALMSVERRPLERLVDRQSELKQSKSALDDMRAKLQDFVSTLKGLSSSGTFDGRTATVSDGAFFTASAAAGSDLGVFDIEVESLASTHKLRSVGLATADTGLVNDGSITIQSGENDPITIDVNAASGNNSLQSVRDAINDADAGVRASILFNGTEYNLIVRAEESGLANQLVISDSTNLDLDEAGNQITAAADAHIKVDGVAITSSTNKITGSIEGVTLDLLATNVGSTEALVVEQDVDGVIEAVQGLVDSYNEITQFFNSQFDRDEPGQLANDPLARSLRARLQSLVTGGVPGIPLGEIRSLGSIGVSFDGVTGELSLDSAELRELLEEGSFDAVGRLFEDNATTTDSRINFASASSATVEGEYAVEITQAAERASVVGSTAILNPGLQKAETLTITVGSETIDVLLAQDAQIGEIVDTINSALTGAGIQAAASDDAGRLSISTDGFGSEQSISVTSSLADPGNGRQTGFDTTATTDTGEDVAGKIGGVDAIGVGRLLTGAEGEPVAGLTVSVTATAAEIAATGGDFGTVTYSAGLSQRLTAAITRATQFGDGEIDRSIELIDDQVKRLTTEIFRLEERLVDREAFLIRKFGAAEQAIALLQSQQNSLGAI